MIRFVVSVIASAVILFVWGGATQMLPWGITSTQNVTTLHETASSSAPSHVRVSSSDIIGDGFEEQFNLKFPSLLRP